jgi:5-methylcytosine-specific restriction endonuclease McrA
MAMFLTALSNNVLDQKMKFLAQREREITLEVLQCLQEVERRRLFSELGYGSLFEYAVKQLKYSEGSAGRRIASMRLLNEIPELKDKIESGDVSLSALSQASMFFKKEAIQSKEEKIEVLAHVESKSAREVEKELVSRSSDPVKLIPEKLRAISGTHSELKIILEESFLNEIEELRNLISNAHPGASIKEILGVSVRMSLKQLRPKAPKEKSAQSVTKQRDATPAPEFGKEKSRYVAREVKRSVWQRDKGECTYKSSEGRKCTCKHNLEFDHIVPFALGGTNTTENLRLRCRAHNQLAAIKIFGQKKMQAFVPSLRYAAQKAITT